MSKHEHIGVAGLLHDIGKLYQRAYWSKAPADVQARHHAAYTDWFIDKHANLFKQAAIDTEWLRQTAKRHHNNQNTPSEYRPQSVDEWLVYYADNYASYERTDRDSHSTTSVPNTALKPIFSDIRLKMESQVTPATGYDLEPLRLSRHYPSQRTPNVRSDAYDTQLVEPLEKRLKSLGECQLTAPTLLMNLAGLLQESCSCVPSDTQGEPDVSLYDHLRLTSAFATTLYLYHQANNSLNIPSLKDETPAKFLLVLGDLGGIQDHIYRINRAPSGSGALAKRLRARSLEVSLSSEAFSAYILEQLELSPLQRIMSAGGKFYLLLPNTEPVIAILNNIKAQWQQHSQSGGASLSPHLAWHAFRADELKSKQQTSQGFAGILQAAHAALGKDKLQPFQHHLGQALLFPQALRPCAIYDNVPAERDEAGAISRQARRDEQIGRRLPKISHLSIDSQSNGDYNFPGISIRLGDEGAHVLRGQLDFSPASQSWEIRSLLGHLPTVGHARQALDISNLEYTRWLEHKNLLDDEDDLSSEDDRPLTFSEIAALSNGTAALGALMLDADHMGEIFQKGFAQTQSTGADSFISPSRIASLSRSLETFFAAEIAALIKRPELYAERLHFDQHKRYKCEYYPLIYTVYAGGDDVFLIGPWNVLLEFALDLNELYQQFTGRHKDFSLSAGFILSKPHLPVPKIAALAQSAEKAAKDSGRNCLTLFNTSVAWSDMSAVRSRAQELIRLLQLHHGALPRSIAYRLLGFHQLWKRWHEHDDPEGLRYKPQLAYLFRRSELQEHQAFFEPLFNHKGPEIKTLPAWLHWAIYQTRGE